MTDHAVAFMRRLDAMSDKPVLLHPLTVDYPPVTPVCMPSDALWQAWWIRVIGPAPTAVVAYLYHLLGSNPGSPTRLDAIAEWVVPIDDPDEDPAVRLRRLQWSITRAAMVRLVGIAPLSDRSDATWVMFLPAWVPRPGRAGWEAIGRSFADEKGDSRS